MDVMVNQQSSFKYFCKICKKGFLCGRALGGHMRAHGVGYERKGFYDDDHDDHDEASEWEDRSQGEGSGGGGGSTRSNNKRMYGLRTNPNNTNYRLNNFRVCNNCGEEFESWKSFLDHDKCNKSYHDVDVDVDVELSSPQGTSYHDDDHDDENKTYVWAKRKRSFRTILEDDNNTNTNINSEEDRELANCLMMLSNNNLVVSSQPLQQEESSTLNIASRGLPPPIKAAGDGGDGNIPKGLFECKACKKVFSSHQALGGHRASHKKVKGCFAAKLDYQQHNYNFSKTTTTLQQHNYKRKSRVHECSICHRIFSSGQALGGHKRCHWITNSDPQHYHHQQQALDLDNVNSHYQNMMLLQSFNWGGINLEIQHKKDDHDHKDDKNEGRIEKENKLYSICESNMSNNNDDDEADSKVKLAKLLEIKNQLNTNGNPSPWLQMGIGSVATNP